MSRYEIIHDERTTLTAKQLIAVIGPAAAIAVLVISTIDGAALAGFISFVFLPILLHFLWRRIFGSYRQWVDRSAQLSNEIDAIRHRLTEIFEAYPARRKGEQFKKAYDLNGRSVYDLEEALAV